ncbi:MAG: alanine dehydrogenase [Acidobacteriota bacterium]
MIIGLPKEIKDNESRVGLTPAGVKTLSDFGHTVLIEKSAGEGSGISDDEFRAAGGQIVETADEVWQRGEMVVKVKEPVGPEYQRMRDGQLLFTYLHLAPDPKLTQAMLASKITGIAYETITNEDGHLPLLTPMSEVAGRMAVQVGAHYLQKPEGGRGVLMGGVPGVLPAKTVIIGGGVVGINSIKMAVGLGANVTVLDKNLERLRYLDDIFGAQIKTLMSNDYNVQESIANADLVIGAVLIPGASAPHLVKKAMLRTMHKGAVIVDVAVDQGGCIETTHPTTHSNPTYFIDDVLHYCVANMPGAVPRTSTFALTNATLPFAVRLANKGFKDAVAKDKHLKAGVNTYAGHITYEAVAESQDLQFKSIDELL